MIARRHQGPKHACQSLAWTLETISPEGLDEQAVQLTFYCEGRRWESQGLVISAPCQICSFSHSLLLTKARAIIQSSSPIVLDTQILDINRSAMKTKATAKIVTTIIINSSERLGCGRLQVALCIFATTVRDEY